MKTPRSTLALFALALLVSAACGDTVKVNETEKGGLGESCRARNDCEGELVCVDNVCKKAASDAQADGAVPQVRGGEGESCQRRADCEADLVCVDNVCMTMGENDGGTNAPAATRGKRGEDCAATSDCEAGLVCIAMRCRQADVDVAYASKACDRVQCRVDDDCCEDWVPLLGASSCSLYKSNCDLDPVTYASYCTYYNQNCICARDCVDEQCIAYTYCEDDTDCPTGPCVDHHCTECTDDVDCGVGVCVSNECVECRVDGDCTNPGEACVQGVCDGGCSRDEQCGLFEKCMDHECTDVGCESDRQCYFATGDERSSCGGDGECVVPCENDAECVGQFSVCEKGVCRFVGCDTDQECRAYFQSIGVGLTGYDAVCREPMP